MSSITSRCPHCSVLNRVPVERMKETVLCGSCKTPLLHGKPIEGTGQNFEGLLNSDKPVIVDFWAPWCSPCVGFSPVFEQVAEEKNQQAHFVKVNTEAQQTLSMKYGIRSIPAILVFKEGRVIDQITGALPKSKFEQWLDPQL